MLTFKKPTQQDKDALLDFKNAHLSHYKKSVIDGGSELHRFDAQSFNEWLDYVYSPIGTNVFGYAKVCSDVFLAYLDNKVVGIVNIRYELDEFLQNIGGHIGYSTHPDYQGRGIASQMTTYALDLLKQHGVQNALITCDDSNSASAKVIEKSGGVLQNTIHFHEKLVRRYWVDLAQ